MLVGDGAANLWTALPPILFHHARRRNCLERVTRRVLHDTVVGMAQEPVKLRRSNPLRVAGLVAGVAVLGVAVWWGSASHRAPDIVPSPNVAAAPVAMASPTAAMPVAPAPAAPSFDIVRVNPQGDTVIAGRAAPGAEVSVQQNGQEIGHARADAQGQFVVLPEKPIAPGAQELTLSARSGDQPAVTGGAPVIVMVPPPQTAQANASAQATPLVVLAQPNAAPRVLQAPAPAGVPARKGLALGSVDYDAAGAIRFSGTADPASPIQVYVDNHAFGQVTTAPDGSWVIGPTNAVPAGDHTLRLDQLGANGAVMARVEVPFRRVVPAEVPIGGTQTVVVQPGESLWRIARRIYGSGVHYTDIYQANLSQIRDPDLIFPGQVFASPARAVGAKPLSSSSSR